jgi:hypothetical protein
MIRSTYYTERIITLIEEIKTLARERTKAYLSV